MTITLIDRRNFHLFQPLLYQVATGALSPANIAAPLRAILKGQKNTRVLLGTVDGLDPVKKTVLVDGQALEYDTLILAVGVSQNYFGRPEWEQYAPGLKTIEDATTIRRRVLLAFENAEREADPVKRNQWLTFAVVGGGPTGVELAGAIAEIAHYTLRENFRAIDPTTAEIHLFEGGDRILPSYPTPLSETARADLEQMGVTVHTRTLVTMLDADHVTYQSGDTTTQLPTHTVLWATGVQASPLAKTLHETTDCELDKFGRVKVQPDCSVKNFPDIFVIGDVAHFAQDGKLLPGVAQVAMQQGRYVAGVIKARVSQSTRPIAPFRYQDLGNMATIGRSSAVADLGTIRLSGFLGWGAWLFIHLMNLVQFQSRVLVLIQWAWSYVTRNRAARLITERNEKQGEPIPVNR
jgi:NADH dehydrogenase